MGKRGTKTLGKPHRCEFCRRTCIDIVAHLSGNFYCKVYQRDRAVAQCRTGALHVGQQEHDARSMEWGSRGQAPASAFETAQAWKTLCREYSSADDEVKLCWRAQLESSEALETEKQRIRKMMMLLKSQGYCTHDRKLGNSKIAKGSAEAHESIEMPEPEPACEVTSRSVLDMLDEWRAELSASSCSPEPMARRAAENSTGHGGASSSQCQPGSSSDGKNGRRGRKLGNCKLPRDSATAGESAKPSDLGPPQPVPQSASDMIEGRHVKSSVIGLNLEPATAHSIERSAGYHAASPHYGRQESHICIYI